MTFALVHSTNFATYPNTAAVGAGQALVDGWTDVTGGKASVASGTMSIVGPNFPTDWIVRPSSEAAIDQQMVVTVKAGAVTPLVLLRTNAARSQAYALWFDSTGYLNLGSIVNNSLNIISQTPGFTYSASTDYVFTATATTTGGTTTLTCSIATVAAPNTALGTKTGQDSTASLQTAGSPGLASAGSSMLVEQVQSYGPAPTTLNVVYIGDSRTNGVNGSNAGLPSATRLATVAAGLPAVMNNQGYSGRDLPWLISQAATFNALWDPTKTNIAVVQGGTNDFNEGYTVEQVSANTIALFRALVNVHPWIVVWCPELPGAYPGYPANFDSLAASHASWLRANWQSIGIAGLSDVAMDTRIGLPGCEYNATYFSASDHTHLTDAGYAIWGQYDLATIQSVLGSGSGARSASAGINGINTIIHLT